TTVGLRVHRPEHVCKGLSIADGREVATVCMNVRSDRLRSTGIITKVEGAIHHDAFHHDLFLPHLIPGEVGPAGVFSEEDEKLHPFVRRARLVGRRGTVFAVCFLAGGRRNPPAPTGTGTTAAASTATAST